MNNNNSAEKNMDKSAERSERLITLAMEESVRSGKKALLIIILLELLMIISWAMTGSHEMTIASSGYLFCYIFLIVVSGIMLLNIRHAEKDLLRHSHNLFKAQIVYAVLIIFWALAMTWIAAAYRGTFSVLIYITIITIVPTFTYIPPHAWILIEVVAAAPIYYLSLNYGDHTSSFMVNFTVLVVISIVAGLSLYVNRRKGYLKQLELEELLTKNEELAHRDALTNLLNRRSYNEAMDELQENTLPEDLVIASFDVNGLKKVNDTHGHEAGDELLTGAADSLFRAFAPMGRVYRIGGDEFAAILHMTHEQTSAAYDRLKSETEKWNGKHGETLSISAGFAESRGNPGCSANELEITADNLMYVHKKNHHMKEISDCPDSK